MSGSAENTRAPSPASSDAPPTTEGDGEGWACYRRTMAWSLTRLVVLVAILGTVAASAGADAATCDEWSGRLNAGGARELRTIWRELGVRSSLFADTPSLRVTQQELPRPDSRDVVLVLDVTDTARGDWQQLIFRRTGARCRFIGAVDVADQGGEAPIRRLVPLPDGEAALVVLAPARTGTGLALQRETWYLVRYMGGLERAPQAPRARTGSGNPRRPSVSRARTGPRKGLPRDSRSVAAGSGLSRPRPHDRLALDVRSILHDPPCRRVRARRHRRGQDRVPRRVHERQLHLLDAGGAPVRVHAARLLHLEARRPALRPRSRRAPTSTTTRSRALFHDAEEQFLRHNVQELAQLAERANDGQRAWLRHFLDSVPDGPEKRAVMENLR